MLWRCALLFFVGSPQNVLNLKNLKKQYLRSLLAVPDDQLQKASRKPKKPKKPKKSKKPISQDSSGQGWPEES